MKLSELRPCDRCHGQVAPFFYVLRISQAFIIPEHANTVLGMTQMFGGSGAGLTIAETMAPRAEDAVKILAEEPEGEWTDIRLCQSCALDKEISLGALMEARCDALKKFDGGDDEQSNA